MDCIATRAKRSKAVVPLGIRQCRESLRIDFELHSGRAHRPTLRIANETLQRRVLILAE